MEQYHSECVMHVEDRRTRMLLPVLGHADTKHVVPAPCMTLLQRPGRGGGQMQSLNTSGGHATRWDAAAHRTSRRPSPLCPPPVSMLRCRLAPGGRWAAAGCAAAEIQQQQLKFSRSQQSARQGESAACRPTWLPKGRGTVAGLLGSHLIGAACPRAPWGALCPCREGCSDRGTLGSRLKEPEGASAAPPD